MKGNASLAKPVENVSFDSQYHAEFRQRYNALKERPKMPIKVIIVVITLGLCVLNLLWNTSVHFEAVKVKGDTKPDLLQVTQGTQSFTDTGGLQPLNVHVQTYPQPPRKSKVDRVTGKVHPSNLYPKPPPVTHNQRDPHSPSNQRPNVRTRPSLKDVLASEKKPRPPLIKSKEQTVPIYYVNLERAKDRRHYIETHLAERNLKGVRVEAVESLENTTVAVVSPLSMVNPNNKEVACIVSHLIAIHKAVHDQIFFAASPYALIIEDDVKFEFPINWNELLYNAPEDFDVLQLMTSNSEQVAVMAEYYDSTLNGMIKDRLKRNISSPDLTKHHLLWMPRQRGSPLWSTQAYAIRKDNVRHIIDRLVKWNNVTGEYSVTVRNTPNQISYCKQVNGNSCKLLYPFRLVADVYLYDVLGLAYVARLPFFNGVTGYNSSIQAERSDKSANVSFVNIGGVVSYVRKYCDELLPSGLLLQA